MCSSDLDTSLLEDVSIGIPPGRSPSVITPGVIAKPVLIKATNVRIYYPEDNDSPIFIQDVEQPEEPYRREYIPQSFMNETNDDCCCCCNCCECCNTRLCKYIKSSLILIIVIICIVILIVSTIISQI